MGWIRLAAVVGSCEYSDETLGSRNPCRFTVHGNFKNQSKLGDTQSLWGWYSEWQVLKTYLHGSLPTAQQWISNKAAREVRNVFKCR